MNRKKPFSGKQKKAQLKEKNIRKKEEKSQGKDGAFSSIKEKEKTETFEKKDDERKLSHKQSSEKYKLQLESEAIKSTKQSIDLRHKHITIPEQEQLMEICYEDIHCDSSGTNLELPQKPDWTPTLTKRELTDREEQAFQSFQDKLKQSKSSQNVGYVEHNLNTWRQLWHVMEISDIVLMVTDARHPVFHLPSSLLHFVLEEYKKPAILILNKIDLTSHGAVVAWKEYFLERFPSLRVCYFTSYPKEPELQKILQSKILKRPKRKKGGYSAVGITELLQECEALCPDTDFSSWKELLFQGKGHYNQDSPAASLLLESTKSRNKDNSVMTIGLIGHPNVGKSTFLNALIGEKVVSTSKSPGHTKYFQTIHLTENIRLCDCPGLVFPSQTQKELQVLCGIYPIAQLKDPFPSVAFIAERVPLHKILGVETTCIDYEEPGVRVWTAYKICEAWAHKRGYFTAKVGRPDVYRAANSILRLVVDGRICFRVYPPGYVNRKVEYESCTAALDIVKMQRENTGLKDSNEAWSDDESVEEEATSDDRDSEESDEHEMDLVSTNRFCLLAE